MKLQIYFTPTKVIFGKNAEEKVGLLLKQQKCKKVLIHYGGNSAKKSGLLDRIKHSLNIEGIAYIEFGGVVQNPQLSLVYKGIELSKKEGVDFILAVGGGSVIDSAKAIGYGVTNEGDVWDFYASKRNATSCLPIGAVLTVAAAGSEMNQCSVITKEKGRIKRAYENDLCRPVFSIMNPELTMTVPAYQTSCGGIDILMHTMERYFNNSKNMELTDSISEAIMRNVIKNTKILLKNPNDYDTRAQMMWAGSLSDNGLTGFGSDGGDWATHMLEHELSAMFNVTHGAGLAAIWGSWARYVYKENMKRFAKFAINVMEVMPCDNIEHTAIKGIEAVEEFCRSINMPISIKELGINVTDFQIEEMAGKCDITNRGSIGVVKKLKKDDMIAIYKAAR